jgi:hypothetical protein
MSATKGFTMYKFVGYTVTPTEAPGEFLTVFDDGSYTRWVPAEAREELEAWGLI